MTIIPIQEAQAKLLELIRQLSPGEQLLITENDQPIACLSLVTGPASSTDGKRDWWAAIRDVEERQKLRGFEGQASDINRDDQGYQDRMNQIYKDTIPRN